MVTPNSAILSERTLSLAAAARLLPPGRRGRPVTLSCLLRWVIDGVRVPGRTDRVRLEAIRMSSRWITSVEALERFAARQTPDFSNPPPMPRSPNARQRASERAARELEKHGI